LVFISLDFDVTDQRDIRLSSDTEAVHWGRTSSVYRLQEGYDSGEKNPIALSLKSVYL